MKCEKCNNWVDCQYKEKGLGFCLCQELFTYTKLDDNEPCEDFVTGCPMSPEEFDNRY